MSDWNSWSVSMFDPRKPPGSRRLGVVAVFPSQDEARSYVQAMQPHTKYELCISRGAPTGTAQTCSEIRPESS